MHLHIDLLFLALAVVFFVYAIRATEKYNYYEALCWEQSSGGRRSFYLVINIASLVLAVSFLAAAFGVPLR